MKRLRALHRIPVTTQMRMSDKEELELIRNKICREFAELMMKEGVINIEANLQQTPEGKIVQYEADIFVMSFEEFKKLIHEINSLTTLLPTCHKHLVTSIISDLME